MSKGIFTTKLKKAARARAESLSGERRAEIARGANQARWLNPHLRRKIVVHLENRLLDTLRLRAEKNGRTVEEEATAILEQFNTPWDV